MKLPHITIAASAVLLAGLMVALAPTTAEGSSNTRTSAPTDFIIRNARVFDGARIWPMASVHVRDGRIVEFAPRMQAAPGVAVVEAAGRTLLPGLIDAHVHTWGDARRDALRFGVTTELDMFSDYHQITTARAERESLARTDRADSWSAGTLATAPGGHGTEFGVSIPTLHSPAQAPAWVAARKAEGSDYIKIVRRTTRGWRHGSDRGRCRPSMHACPSASRA